MPSVFYSIKASNNAFALASESSSSMFIRRQDENLSLPMEKSNGWRKQHITDEDLRNGYKMNVCATMYLLKQVGALAGGFIRVGIYPLPASADEESTCKQVSSSGIISAEASNQPRPVVRKPLS